MRSYPKLISLFTSGTLAVHSQVLEEGKLSTCKLYVYVIYIYRVLLFGLNLRSSLMVSVTLTPPPGNFLEYSVRQRLIEEIMVGINPLSAPNSGTNRCYTSYSNREVIS